MKKTIRRAMRTKNLSIDKELRENYANEIFMAIESDELFKNATTIALYASLSDELPTDTIINRWSQTKRILLPRIGEDCAMEFYQYYISDIESGAYGILEPQGDYPIYIADIDLIIVPGVAFTLDGKRLGRGKGYYDRYLSRADFRAHTIGVCYAHQILDDLPTEEHDVVLDMVATPSL
ncbi:MAG: 5-formyltetrahydrofolate cyclo-ligase [Rikenellaceae bacterium]